MENNSESKESPSKGREIKKVYRCPQNLDATCTNFVSDISYFPRLNLEIWIAQLSLTTVAEQMNLSLFENKSIQDSNELFLLSKTFSPTLISSISTGWLVEFLMNKLTSEELSSNFANQITNWDSIILSWWFQLFVVTEAMDHRFYWKMRNFSILYLDPAKAFLPKEVFEN